VRHAIAIVFAAASAGCLEFGDGDAKVPGEPLGTYRVTGRLEDDGCRAPVLGVTDPWHFEIKLSRFAQDLYWLNGREAIVGEIAADDVSFRFETQVDIELSEMHGRVPGCTIERTDRAAGKLGSGGTDVATFEGGLSFVYSQEEHSDCSAAVEGPESGFAVLPCTIAYGLRGVRIEAESPAKQ